jgi:hypothetical protein
MGMPGSEVLYTPGIDTVGEGVSLPPSIKGGLGTGCVELECMIFRENCKETRRRNLCPTEGVGRVQGDMFNPQQIFSRGDCGEDLESQQTKYLSHKLNRYCIDQTSGTHYRLIMIEVPPSVTAEIP